MGLVSKVTLVKDGRTAIFQGMWHIAPFAFYEYIQMEIDRAEDGGDLIFYEGIKIEDLPPPSSFNEKMIRAFWMHWFESYKLQAKLKKCRLESECLTFPGSAIRADIDLAEMARLLYENRFRCKLLTLLLNLANPRNRLRITVAVEDALLSLLDGKSVVPENWREEALVKMFAPLGRKMLPVIITHRNAVAVDTVRNHDKGDNLLILYGNAHISGLVNLFILDGWSTQETKEIDPKKVKRPIIITVPDLKLSEPIGTTA